MSPEAKFEFIVFLLLAIIVLVLIAKRIGLPPAGALILGGIGLAFIPGVPAIALDPAVVLVVFLPPLLMSGAFFTALSDFRRNFLGILSLAVGAVVFTTVVVGAVAHWIMPGLPWAACFALGAVVSPPDAVAAKSVLESVKLPRRLMVLLEGESLLNDAAGLVLFRFAVAAALTGAFDVWEAAATFSVLAAGGVALGALTGLAWARFTRHLEDTSLIIAASFLLPWAAYIGGEALHVSGVIATVAAGLVFGWRQHDVFTATVRIRGSGFWQVVVFVMEAFVFVLIGLSMRGVVERLGGIQDAAQTLALPVGAVVIAVVASRFVWVFAGDAMAAGWRRLLGRRGSSYSPGASVVMSWAGMRGVVTLAIALSVPEQMPGHDLILASAFVVILVTVLLQGTTIGPLIRLVGLVGVEVVDGAHLTRAQAVAKVTLAQLAAVERLARNEDGTVRHPRLLEQYAYVAQAAGNFSTREVELAGDRTAHFEVVLAAIGAGRAEVLRLHRSGAIHDEVLHHVERNLDLQEIAADMERG